MKSTHPIRGRAKKINTLKTLAKDNKKNLIKIHQQIQKKFEAL